tara:strand:- start:281 stop:634 length:354 start_codon:yes stop_codon:yes gene_type:complete
MSLLSDVWGESWKSSNISSLKPLIGGSTNTPINISYNSKNISNYNSNNSQLNNSQLNNSQLIINNLIKENNLLKETFINKNNNIINYDDENFASSVLIGYFLLFIMDTFVDLGKQLT